MTRPLQSTLLAGAILVLPAILVLSGCSTGGVELAKPNSTASIEKPAVGTGGKSGPVVASANAAQPNCRLMTETMATEIARLDTIPVKLRTEAEQPPTTLTAMFARSSDPVRSLPAHKDYTASRARLEDQNQQLSGLGCPPVDLNARLSRTEKAMSTDLWRYGTEGEAKAMLSVAFTDLASDREKALRRMRDGWEAYKSRDIQLSCAERESGRIVSSPRGSERLQDLQDAKQGNLGSAIAKAASGASATAPKEVIYPVAPAKGSLPGSRVAFVAQNDTLICWTSAYR